MESKWKSRGALTETAYLGLGSNLGDRLGTLQSAVDCLGSQPQISALLQMSTVYESEPVGIVEQPDFLNACVSVRTEASPQDLLRCLVRVEELHHRQRSVRWGPRTLDLDLLLYGDRSMSSPQLTVPHPRMSQRCFVLVPLCEIAPDLLHPLSGRAFAEYCRDLDCSAQVRPSGALKTRRLDP